VLHHPLPERAVPPSHADLAANILPSEAILAVPDDGTRVPQTGFVRRLRGGSLEDGVDETGLRWVFMRRHARLMRVGSENYAVIPKSAIVSGVDDGPAL